MHVDDELEITCRGKSTRLVIIGKILASKFSRLYVIKSEFSANFQKRYFKASSVDEDESCRGDLGRVVIFMTGRHIYLSGSNMMRLIIDEA